jgi:hypothetical protein
MPLLVVPWPGRRHLPKRPCRVCCSGFLECLQCGAVPIPLYCLCLLARAMPLWNYYFSMLHRSPFPTLRGLRTAVVPMLRPSSHWLQWTSQLPRCVGDSPLSRGCGSCIQVLSRCFSPSVHQLLRRVDDLVPTLARGLISFTACLRHPTCARRAHTSWRSAAYAEKRHPRQIGGKDPAKNSRGAAPHSSLTTSRAR